MSSLLVIYVVAIACIILYLPSIFHIPFATYATVIGILFIRTTDDKQSHQELYSSSLITCVLVLAGLFLLIARVLPYLELGHLGFGYDIGYYKRYIDLPTPSLIGQYSYLLGNESIGARMLINILKLLGVPGSFILFGVSSLFSIGSGYALFWLVRMISTKTVASLALLLYAVSLVQFEAFQLMLWKQQLTKYLSNLDPM